jgi:Fe-S cluster assembly protein SufB
MSSSQPDLDALVAQKYRHGFVTDVESETLPPGLDEDVVRRISQIKREPEFLLAWRLQALRHWLTMHEPQWAHLRIAPVDYQSISYYSAPKVKTDGPKSLDEVDPKLLATYEKLGVPLHERARLAGVAVDAVFDSVSVATTFKEKLARAGVIFCSFSDAVRNHPSLVEQYLGSVVPYTDNYFATLNSAVFSDGSFVYVPKGVRCPMELSTYFRINAANTGQFERTLIVADEDSHVSYLEGCTAPMRDENQLHAAVVELVALAGAHDQILDGAELVPGRRKRRRGHLQLRHQARRMPRHGLPHQLDPGRDRLRHHLEVPELRAHRRQLGGRVLLRGPRQPLPAGRHRHQDDSHRPQHAQRRSSPRASPPVAARTPTAGS